MQETARLSYNIYYRLIFAEDGMRVAICDDVQQDREVLFACLTSIFAELQVEAEIISFSSGTELIQNYPNDLDFLVLDIQMNEMDGIETARKIREFDASLCIEFLTNMPQFARDCYKVRAFGYLLKPVSYEELRLEIMEALALNKIQNSKYLVVKNRDVKKRIAVTDIIYVEYIDHKLKIVTVDSEEHMYGALTDLEKTLNGVPFIRPHAAFIVNMKYVLSVSRDTIMMMNQAVIPLSRNRKREIFAKWESFAK